MSDWAYVALAYTVVWGSLAVYALVLARRVSQARQVSRRLRASLNAEAQGRAQANEQDTICDAPPAP